MESHYLFMMMSFSQSECLEMTSRQTRLLPGVCNLKAQHMPTSDADINIYQRSEKIFAYQWKEHVLRVMVVKVKLFPTVPIACNVLWKDRHFFCLLRRKAVAMPAIAGGNHHNLGWSEALIITAVLAMIIVFFWGVGSCNFLDGKGQFVTNPKCSAPMHLRPRYIHVHRHVRAESYVPNLYPMIVEMNIIGVVRLSHPFSKHAGASMGRISQDLAPFFQFDNRQ